MGAAGRGRRCTAVARCRRPPRSQRTGAQTARARALGRVRLSRITHVEAVAHRSTPTGEQRGTPHTKRGGCNMLDCNDLRHAGAEAKAALPTRKKSLRC